MIKRDYVKILTFEQIIVPFLIVTTVMIASKYGNIEMYKFLINKNTGFNTKDEHRWIALIHTIWNSNKSDNYEVIKLLIRNGAKLDIKDNYGWTALMYVVRNTNKDSTENTVKILLEYIKNNK